jgi:hypothetical protein
MRTSPGWSLTFDEVPPSIVNRDCARLTTFGVDLKRVPPKSRPAAFPPGDKSPVASAARKDSAVHVSLSSDSPVKQPGIGRSLPLGVAPKSVEAPSLRPRSDGWVTLSVRSFEGAPSRRRRRRAVEVTYRREPVRLSTLGFAKFSPTLRSPVGPLNPASVTPDRVSADDLQAHPATPALPALPAHPDHPGQPWPPLPTPATLAIPGPPWPRSVPPGLRRRPRLGGPLPTGRRTFPLRPTRPSTIRYAQPRSGARRKRLPGGNAALRPHSSGVLPSVGVALLSRWSRARLADGPGSFVDGATS